MKNLFISNNKKLLDNIMSKEEGIINGKSDIDVHDIAFQYPFECSLPHLLSDQRNEEQHLFI